MTDPLDAAALFRRLHEAGVVYVVIGGFAVIAHGVQRFTNDLDITPAPDRHNLTRLAQLLKELDGRQLGVGDFELDEFPGDPTDAADLAAGGNFRLSTSVGALDIMQWVPGIPDDHAYPVLAPDAVTGRVHGVPVAVCSLQHLQLMKRAAGRPQDLLDLEDLETGHQR